MRSSHGRSRRRRDSNGGDDNAMLVSRGDEPHSDSNSRNQQETHHSESYSTSSRAPYDMNRDASSSRTHHDSDGWRTDPNPHSERYAYSSNKSSYHGVNRDGWVEDSGSSEIWIGHDPSYGSSQREWSERDFSYASSSWVPSSSYLDRDSNYRSWDIQDDRHNRVALDASLADRDNSAWHERRRESGGPKWEVDSGWDSRRTDRDKGWKDTRSWNRSSREDSHRPADDRSWEPAPTWQASNNGDNQGRRDHGNRNNNSNKGSKGGRKGQQHNNKSKRDWRTDDGNLNNWQKRDTASGKASRTPSKRRNVTSDSRSRSRSPPASLHSHRSSRGRSRSPSLSPKRTRNSSPAAIMRTPVEKERTGWNEPQDPAFSRSPTMSRRGRSGRSERRRSMSSASSTSRSRSSSRSPANRPRAVHRLPPATSLKDISVIRSKNSRTTGSRATRELGSNRNGKHQSNGRHDSRGMSSNSRTGSNLVSLALPSSSNEMPPPTSIPLTNHRMPSNSDSLFSDELPRDPRSLPPSKGTRVEITKKAGFKPISQATSALKRFFPDDDVDVDETPSGKEPAQTSRTQTRGGAAQSFLECSPPPPPVRDQARYQNPFRQPSIEDLRVTDVHQQPVNILDPPSRAFVRDPVPTVEVNGDSSTGATAQEHEPPLDRSAHEETRPSTPPGSRSELYAIVSQVGEGTFGKVYKARNTVTKVYVALKRIRMEAERDGFPVTAMREIKLLQSLRHENIVRLYEMMVSNGSVYMVFEYMDHDLTGVLSQTQFNFSEANLKSLCQQMLAGLVYLHHKGVIHRDIKGSNILINNRGELKLGDFGLARFYQKRRRADYTNRVITLWYRPPELLFGATVYGPEVDMWSAGCIMLELFTKKPVFQGNDEIHQLDVIFKIFGTPSGERWPGVTELPWYELVKPREVIPNHFREYFQKWMSTAALDLAETLLSYDPSNRATAAQALEAPYFTQEFPRPELPVGLSTLEGEWHELETKRERAKKRRKTEQ